MVLRSYLTQRPPELKEITIKLHSLPPPSSYPLPLNLKKNYPKKRFWVKILKIYENWVDFTQSALIMGSLENPVIFGVFHIWVYGAVAG